MPFPNHLNHTFATILAGVDRTENKLCKTHVCREKDQSGIFRIWNTNLVIQFLPFNSVAT